MGRETDKDDLYIAPTIITHVNTSEALMSDEVRFGTIYIYIYIYIRGVPRGVSRGFRKPLLDFTTTSASQIVYQLYLTKTISIIDKNLTIQ